MLPEAVARSFSDINVVRTSGFVNDVMTSYNGRYDAWRWQYQRGRRVHKFSTYSTGDAMLFNFSSYSGSKLHTGAKSVIYDCLLTTAIHPRSFLL